MSESLIFGSFLVHPRERRVLRAGEPLALGSRAFDVLVALARRSGSLATKSELLNEAWPGRVVEENNLAVQITTLRRLLGDDAIQTVPGHGYRLNPALCDRPPAAPAADEACLGPMLYGRDADRQRVLELLQRARLVTVCGAAGIGKTRLAAAVAEQVRGSFAGGCSVVPLADLRDTTLVAPAVARGLSLALPGHSDPVAELVGVLRSRQCLVVLDNCEHLVEGVAALVSRLLDAAPQVRFLATSQLPLRLTAEHVYRLGPLSVPAVGDPQPGSFAAVQMFVGRCRALHSEVGTEGADMDHVVEVCRALDGIPLAIELAAARVPLLGVRGVQMLLGQRFALLSSGARGAEHRHATLHAALDWSYRLLDAPARCLLRRLAVFEGGFSLRGAELVAGDCEGAPIDVLTQLGVLVERSMLVCVPSSHPRWRMLESMREFALQELRSAGELEAWRSRHAAAVREICRDAVRERDTEWLWSELSNARVALSWALQSSGQEQVAVAIATHMSVVLATAGAVPEALDHLQRVLPHVTEEVDARVAARYWQWRGRLGIEGRLPTSHCIDVLQRAAGMFERQGDVRHLHGCRRMLAEAHMASGDLDAADAALEAALRLERGGSVAADRMRRMRVAALLADAHDRSEEALRLAQQALQIADAHGIQRYVHILLTDTAWIRLRMGQADQAADALRQLLARVRPNPRDGLTRSYALAGLGAALLAGERLDEARAYAPETIQTLRASGIFLARGHVFAWLAAACADSALAAQLIGAADRYHETAEMHPERFSRLARDAAAQAIEGRLTATDMAYWTEQGRGAEESTLAHALLEAVRQAVRQAAHPSTSA